MNRQIIHYKITFTGPGNEVEIRYLVMETISYHNYLYFVRKLTDLFPILKDLHFSVNWKDKEGDIIRICSDDELTIALDEMKSDPVKKIFIIVKQQGNDIMLHPDIICDNCEHPIKGFRYKCLVCADYELCSDCERSQTHPDHPLIRIPKPLSPDTPYGKQFIKDIPKISQHLENLFHQTGNDTSQSSNQKSSTDNKRKFKVCHNDVHNLIANLLVEKLIKHNIETSMLQQKRQQEIHSSQSEPSTSTDIHVRNEPPQNVNVLTSELRSLSIDVNSGGTRRDGLTEQDESTHSTSGGQRLVTFTTSPSAANLFSATTVEAATTSEVIAAESNPINQVMSQIDAAPIPADPTPVLQAQLTPPISAVNIVPTPSVLTPVPVSNVSIPTTSSSSIVATAPTQDSLDASSLDNSNNFPAYLIPPPIEDDGSLDNSWSVVGNGETGTSITSSGSSGGIESPEPTPVPPPPELLDSPAAFGKFGKKREWNFPRFSLFRSQTQRPYEESVMMLHTLGFEKKEWVNLVVEAKGGNVREVLRFLSPVKKLSTNLHK